MKYIQSLLLTLAVMTVSTAFAQTNADIYAVKLGQFVNAKSSSFSTVNNLGYIYAVNDVGTVKNVFIGGMQGKAAADKAVAYAKSQGYIDAYAMNLSKQDADTKTFVQLGVRDARQKTDWKTFAPAGRLFALVSGNQLKVLAGPYPDVAAAKAILPSIQRKGFKDAFVKNLSTALVHEVTAFEGGIFDFEEKLPTPIEQPELMTKGTESNTLPKTKETVPQKYEVPVPKKSKEMVPAVQPDYTEVAPVSMTADKPTIRADVKRTSVLELQKILKKEGAYNSSLDGYYGKGTKSAFTQVWLNNQELKKYRVLAQYNNRNAQAAKAGSLQYAIDGLWDDPQNAKLSLQRSASPVAKVYLAYWLYENTDEADKIDALMNAAVKQAFVGKKLKNAPKFDYQANYSYRDFDQLLRHLSYVQSAADERISVPCWMFERHDLKALQMFGTAADAGNVELQDCGGFVDWEELSLLNTIANDMSAGSKMNASKEAKYHAKAVRLLLAPTAPSDSEQKKLEDSQKALMTSLKAWGDLDPTLSEMSDAFTVTYYQSYVLLEDYFAEKGYNAADAKALGLAVLDAVIGGKLNRFM